MQVTVGMPSQFASAPVQFLVTAWHIYRDPMQPFAHTVIAYGVDASRQKYGVAVRFPCRLASGGYCDREREATATTIIGGALNDLLRKRAPEFRYQTYASQASEVPLADVGNFEDVL